LSFSEHPVQTDPPTKKWTQKCINGSHENNSLLILILTLKRAIRIPDYLGPPFAKLQKTGMAVSLTEFWFAKNLKMQYRYILRFSACIVTQLQIVFINDLKQ
jgi:hypothetical protein